VGFCFKVQGWRRPRIIAGVGSPALTPTIIGSGGRFALGLLPSLALCRAKKLGPLQDVPVMARAIADATEVAHGRPSMPKPSGKCTRRSGSTAAR
jgi:hypothetical protein